MDLQANNLLRSLYELILLFLAISIDQSLLNKYLECTNIDKATEMWYKNFRTGNLRKIIEAYEKSHDSSTSGAFFEPHDVVYKRLSAFVHHQTTALFVFNCGKTNDPEDQMIPNMLGCPVTRENTTIDFMCSLMEYVNFMLHVICRDNGNKLAKSLEIKYEQSSKNFENCFNYFLVLADGYHLDLVQKQYLKEKQ